MMNPSITTAFNSDTAIRAELVKKIQTPDIGSTRITGVNAEQVLEAFSYVLSTALEQGSVEVKLDLNNGVQYRQGLNFFATHEYSEDEIDRISGLFIGELQRITTFRLPSAWKQANGNRVVAAYLKALAKQMYRALPN